MNKLGKISLSILGTLIIAGTTAFASTGTISTNGVRMRKEASTDSEILTSLDNGAKVEVLETSGDWYKVKYDNYEGYMHKDYVKVEENSKPTEVATEQVNTESTPEDSATNQELPVAEEQNANIQTITTGIQSEFPKQIQTINETKIYLLPTITSKVKTSVAIQSTITINKQLNNWQYVTTSDNVSGWIRKATTEANTEGQKEVTTNEQTKTELTTTKAYVNASSANIRKEASTSAEVLMAVTNNTEIEVISKDGDWCKIKYQDITGYIYATLVSDIPITTSRSSETRKSLENETATETHTTDLKTGYVNVKVANVRSAATTTSKILSTLNAKTQVEIMGENGNFYEINLNGQIGYISKILISDKIEDIAITEVATQVQTNTEQITSSIGSSEGERIVNFAKQYLGYNYVYGGTTPEGGFDCTGFTYYIYNNCGYSLSRSCSVQAQSGIAVEKANLQLGDLLLFNNTSNGSIGHVGIYIGDGKFIHAANTRRGVVTDTINSGYYYNYYYSARRIAN